MDEAETPGKTSLFNEVLDRFSRLTPDGMQGFMERLIRAAADKPVVAVEVEQAFERLEADVHLRKCWKGWDAGTESSALASEAGTN
jgi:hypothetical protein